MTIRRAAIYSFGGALLVAYLAAANSTPGNETAISRARAAKAAGTSGTQSIAVEVQSQAARLHARLDRAPVPPPNPRNPFAFGLAPVRRPSASMVHATVADVPAESVAPSLPVLTLMGVAEETSPDGPRRTAVIGGDGDAIYLVVEGQMVGDRYRVKKIGADAVELDDVITHGFRRIALQ